MRTSVMQNVLKSNRLSAAVSSSRIVAVVAVLTLSGCDIFWFISESGEADLEGFASATAFKRYLSEQVDAERSRRENMFEWGDVAIGSGPAPSDGAQPAPTAGDADFSTTNIQESGVDESDVVKNDGTYLYILGSNQLKIVRAIPADAMEIVSTVELPGTPEELYLRNDTIVSLGNRQSYHWEPWDVAIGVVDGYGGETGTVVTILDVSDRSAPTVVATIEAEAWLNSSRMIGSKLHLVLSAWPNLPDMPEITPLFSGDPIMNTSIDDLVPDITVTMADGQSTTRNLVEWEDFYHPVDPDGYDVTAVVTIDVDAPNEPVQSVGVLANSGIVYVSTQALYLTDMEYDYRGQTRETTDIYKFDLQQDKAALAGTGSIPGRLLNRFSLGEYQGYLRTATTIGHVSRMGEGDATNNIYVLTEEGSELAVVGSLEGIAPGEQIYSARFIGNRGFLVTFKKVDPLFTFDLSDPANPRVVGELKVPGYSDYIHPLGDNHLLTIGKDAVDMGDFAWYQGVQISVFDVTDFANPQRVDVEIVGDRGTQSEALNNPHAFNYFAPQDTLVVPMVIAEVREGQNQEPSAHGDPVFAGLCLYRVTTDEGVEPIAQIATGAENEIYRYWGDWARGIFIGDYVYAVTDSAVQAAPLDDLNGPSYQLSLE